MTSTSNTRCVLAEMPSSDGGRGAPVERLKAGRRTVTLTDPDRMIFPAGGITKGDLARYYLSVAREMAPHLRGRPLVVEGYPNGIDSHPVRWSTVPEWFPPWVERRSFRHADIAAVHLAGGTPATLLYLVEHGLVAPLTWLSRFERPDHPDRMAFELVPSPETGFDRVREASAHLHEILRRLHLAAYPMTSGKRNISVVVPLTGRDDFGLVRRFADEAAGMAAAEASDLITLDEESPPEDGEVTLRTDLNRPAGTLTVPYAVRPRPEAPVAMPFAWEELQRVRPEAPTVDTGAARLAADQLAGDDHPWHDMQRMARSLSRARKPL